MFAGLSFRVGDHDVELTLFIMVDGLVLPRISNLDNRIPRKIMPGTGLAGSTSVRHLSFSFTAASPFRFRLGQDSV